MKKRYKLESGMDTSITLDIDTEVITEALAHEINGFWIHSDLVLSDSDGDVFQAVARRAAGPLLGFLFDDYTPNSAVSRLSEMEGWPPTETITGIRVVDIEKPELGPLDFEVTTIEVGP
jgi:hypothetical protein